jgi:hypothetical protein
MNIELTKNIDLTTLEIGGIYLDDAPEFCEAHWAYGEYEDGTPLTEAELEALTDRHPVPYEDIINRLY